MLSRQNFDIYHDTGLPICFIGNSNFNRIIFNIVSQERSCENVTVEYAQDQSQSWFDQRQFFFSFGNTAFMKYAAETLAIKNPNYVSFVDTKSSVNEFASIGKNVFLCGPNLVFDTVNVKNHAFVSTSVLTHQSEIGEYCHVGNHSYTAFAKLGQGTCLGMSSIIIGRPGAIIEVADWTNFYVQSLVTKSITTSGTYKSNELIKTGNSLTNSIL